MRQSSFLIQLAFTIFIVSFSVSNRATAQSSPPPVIPAIKTDRPPVLDGRLSPGEWDKAAVLKHQLTQTRPYEGEKPSKPTIIYVFYDQDYLYIAARMSDDPEKIIAREMIQGTRIRNDDLFKVIISPFNNKLSGYYFRVNANGVRQDALFEGPNEKNFNWDSIWMAESSMDEKGWSTEIRIPFKSLNFDPNITDWGISFGRDIARNNERNAWTYFDSSITLDNLGILSGLSGINQGLGLDIVASVAVRRDQDYEENMLSTRLEPSIDAFYNITPSLTAVLTVNTDFSATEIDDQVVNLSRFSVFLPEKRDFFLQDADIFNFGGLGRNGRPFFSRTIGLDDEGEELKVQVGGKLTGRIGKWNIGLLDVVQENPSGSGSNNLFVGRVQRRILDQSTLGMIVTHGDPVSGSGAYTVGADFLYRDTNLIKDKTVVASFWGQKTHTPDEADEAAEADEADDADYGKGDETAYGAEIDIESRVGLEASLEYTHIGDSFNPAMGFVNRTGYDKVDGWLAYAYRPKSTWLRTLRSRIWKGYWHDLDGNLESDLFFFKPLDIVFLSNDRLEFSINHDREILTEDFELLDDITIPAGDYSFSRKEIMVDSASNRIAGIYAAYEWGDYYSGTTHSFRTGIRIQPSKYLRLIGSYSQNKLEMPDGSFTTRQLSAQVNVAFNNALSWSNRIQYNNVSRQAAIFSRLRYNPEPGRDLYILFNHGLLRDEITDRFSSTSNQLGAKVGYTLRF